MCVSLSFPHSLSVSLAHTLPLSISLSLSHSHGVHASCYATALPTAQEGDCHLLVKSFAETCSGKKKKTHNKITGRGFVPIAWNVCAWNEPQC